MAIVPKTRPFGVALLSCLCVLTSTIIGISCREQDRTKTEPAQPELSIRLGLIPETNLFSQRKRYQPVVAYVSKQVGAKIVLVSLSRYGNIVDNFVSNDLDGAFFGSFTAALAQRKLGVQPLARPEYADGTSTYHGLIFVRKDSGIRNASDMRGKRFAFVDRATTAGYLLPLHYFQVEGIEDYRSWLKETYFTGTHEGAIQDVLSKKADIGAAKNTIFYMLAREDRRILDDLIILSRSPDVPENGLCVRSDLDDSLKHSLKDALLKMNQGAEGKAALRSFGAERFISTVAEDYAPVFAFAADIGLDLETYNYVNE